MQTKLINKTTKQKDKAIVHALHKYWFLKKNVLCRGLCIFYPISKDHFFVFKQVFSENSVLMYGLYSRAAYDGTRTVYDF